MPTKNVNTSEAEPDLTAPEMLNLADYPVEDIHSAAGLAFANRCRADYLRDGLCVLPSFVLPRALKLLKNEANQLSDKAYFCDSTHNVYLTQQDTNKSNTAVVNRQLQTHVGSVAYDYLDPNGYLRTLYQWNPLKDFIGFVLRKSSIHHLADPLGACSINVFVNGGEHGWHFDESEFTVTLMLQAPECGGSFDYVPKIRGRANEQEVVARVLDGVQDYVTQLPFNEGTLLIFGGQQTLHRVSRVSGNRPRLVPVLCYSEQRDAVNSEAVRKLFWGRTQPITKPVN